MLQTRTIYSLLLPQEESYRFAKDTLMIREETLPDIGVTEACLTSAVANKFNDAIAGFNRFHSKKWLLQRQLQIEKPYKNRELRCHCRSPGLSTKLGCIR